MSSTTPAAMLAAAIHAAREAGAIQLASRGQRLTEYEKEKDHTFATEVDYRCEQAIIGLLRARFPSHGFLAEESGRSGLDDAEYVWVIDPLDGTIAYVSGQPYFSVSIGLLHRGVPVVGVVNVPALGNLYSAARGAGAFRNASPIRVGAERRLDRAIIGLDLRNVGARLPNIQRFMVPLVEHVRFAYVFGGAAANLAFVADASFDGYAHIASRWDFAAGVVLIEEAGGRVSDPDGRPLDWSSDTLALVAGNPWMHAAILERLRASP